MELDVANGFSDLDLHFCPDVLPLLILLPAVSLKLNVQAPVLKSDRPQPATCCARFKPGHERHGLMRPDQQPSSEIIHPSLNKQGSRASIGPPSTEKNRYQEAPNAPVTSTH